MNVGKASFETIEDFYNFLFNGAQAIISEGVEHDTMIFILTREDEVAISPIKRMTKDMVSATMHYLSQMVDVRAVALVTEAYMIPATSLARLIEINDVKGGDLSREPDRQEAVLFNIITAGRQAIMPCKIDREKKTLEKAKFEFVDEKNIAFGRFAR